MASNIGGLRLAGVTTDSAGERKRDRRLLLGLSVSALAKRAGVDRATLKRVEADDPDVRDTSVVAIERALTELEQEMGMDDPDGDSSVVRFTVRGVYGAESLVVEGPVENIAELERSVDRIMRRLRDTPDS